MKKFLFYVLLFVATSGAAHAECSAMPKIYTACKTGYYLSSGGGSCKLCPVYSGTNRGTSDDRNTAGISACYVPSGTPISDTNGTYECTDNMPYHE